MEQKKIFERKYLNYWIENRFNQTKITVVDYEKPDFIIMSDETSYGVEVTEFYNDYSKNGSLSKKEQKHLERVWFETKRYLKENHPYHRVSINYRHTKDKKIDFNGKDIIRILDSNINYVSPIIVVRPENINLVQIRIEIKSHPSGLNCYSTTDYNRFKESSLIEIIDEKTKKKKLWKDNYNMSVLLIHTSLDFSNNINPPIQFVEDYSDYYSEWDDIILIFQINVKEVKLMSLF